MMCSHLPGSPPSVARQPNCRRSLATGGPPPRRCTMCRTMRPCGPHTHSIPQAHAISDLIGLDYFFLFLKFPDKLKHIDPRLLGPCVTTYSGAQTHMGCSWVEVSTGAGGAFGETTAAEGLIAGHAYSILDVRQPAAGGGQVTVRTWRRDWGGGGIVRQLLVPSPHPTHPHYHRPSTAK